MNHVAPSLINLSAVAKARMATDPYPFFIGSGFLDERSVNDLSRDFPPIQKAGFIAVPPSELRGSFRRFVHELESSELAEAVSDRIGIDLDGHRRVTTIRKYSAAKEGPADTDSQAKIAALLVYLNDAWSSSDGGRLRVLHGPDDLDDMAAEIPPTMGSIFGFRRTENSWHGHTPFAGERRVVQVAWLQDAAAPAPNRSDERKTFSQRLKSVFRR
jgi:SM-20-related protein